MHPSRDIARLLEIMKALRDPETGCPWDIKQDFATVVRYTIEEAYEVADAVERQDFEDLCDELGDLLLQPVFHAQMAQENNLFDFGDVVYAITDKLIRRHPHVFGDLDASDAASVKIRWEDIKSQERVAKADRRQADAEQAIEPSILDDVPLPLPALLRAQKLDRRAANAGFDWPDTASVLAKCREELAEVEDALKDGRETRISEEIGDLLFAVASMARHAGVDAEVALREANSKFTRRFKYVEKRCAESGRPMPEVGMETLDAYWNEIRAQDKQS